MKWKIVKKEIASLKEWNKNPRKLTKKGMDDLKKSIKKFGCVEPIVINIDNTICGGHGRKKILEQLNIKEVDCYEPERELTKKEFEELNIRLNKNIAGEFDFDILANEFDLDDLLGWGFAEFELGIFADIDDINEVDEISESINFAIECNNFDELKELQKILGVASKKINFKDFKELVKT